MGKNENSLKENIKEELRESSSQIKASDLKIDENIDDKYTNTVLSKHANGTMKNNWFVWSGGLSIAFGIACIVAMLIVGIVFVFSTERLQGMSGIGNYDYDAEKNKILICSIVLPIIGIISIIVGAKIFTYSRYTKEALIDNLGKIIFVTVLQFIFGGVITVALTLVGYFVGIGSDYGVIFYNRIDKSEQRQKLVDAKILYEKNLIDYDEYMRLKRTILDDLSDKDI